jgi:GrpB-like predicted nucleotidyltransferase (UPF0157 family)
LITIEYDTKFIIPKDLLSLGFPIMKRVIVVPYDPKWPKEFTIASREITTAMGSDLLQIHHIGSTAVPGLCAKPVIDMLAVVADIEALDRSTPQMVNLGYEAMGEFGISGRRYFRRDNPIGDRTHQVHAFEIGSAHIQRHLLFRHYLRTHPEVAVQYGDLKQMLAAAHPRNIEAYMDGKDAFIKDIDVKAALWSRSVK